MEEPGSPSSAERAMATGTIVGRGVRVGGGVAVGGAGVGVSEGVGVGVGVSVSVDVGVGKAVSVGVGVSGTAVAVSVPGTGDGVRVGGLRVGVGEGRGVLVAAGWLRSGHTPTASMKIQSFPYVLGWWTQTKTVMVGPVALADTVRSGHGSTAHADGPHTTVGDWGSMPPVGSRPILRSKSGFVGAAQPASDW